MINYHITCSVAYRADSIRDLNVNREPWLHVRLVSINRRDKGQIAWYAVTYVWDTREVVDFKDITSERYSSVRWTKALDNGRPLKDKQKLLPGWVAARLCGKTSPDKVSGKYELTGNESLPARFYD